MENNWEFISFSDAPNDIIDGDRGRNHSKQDDFFSQKSYCLFLNTLDNSNLDWFGF